MTIEVNYRDQKTTFEIGGSLPCSITKNSLVLEIMQDYSYRVFDLISTHLLYEGILEPVKQQYAA